MLLNIVTQVLVAPSSTLGESLDFADFWVMAHHYDKLNCINFGIPRMVAALWKREKSPGKLEYFKMDTGQNKHFDMGSSSFIWASDPFD